MVMHKLRAHDTNIISLEWMLIDETLASAVSDAVENKVTKITNKATDKRVNNIKRTKAREPPKPIVDADDMFDMYSYDYSEEEFGTITKPRQVYENILENSFDEKIANEQIENENNENFDFVEACQTLRDEIKGTKSNDELSDQNEELAVNMSDIRKVIKLPDHKSDTEVSLDSLDVSCNLPEENMEKMSNRSTIGSSHDESELADIETKLDSLELEGKLDGNDDEARDERQIYLASGAQEPFVIIWDINTGNICKKVQLKTQGGKLAIPSKTCFPFKII